MGFMIQQRDSTSCEEVYNVAETYAEFQYRQKLPVWPEPLFPKVTSI
jgi:hypothetical protein